MTPKISRRTFILSTMVSSISLCIGGWWFFKVRHQDTTDIVIAIVQKNLSYLIINNKDLIAFAEDFQKFIHPNVQHRISWLGLLTPLYHQFDVFKYTAYVDIFEELEKIVIFKFLMSSDFFLYNADTTRPIKYLRLYDPYDTFCTNPFAEFG